MQTHVFFVNSCMYTHSIAFDQMTHFTANEARQWACDSGDQCVPDFWHCDGQSDCRDGSDEAGCKCRGTPTEAEGGGWGFHANAAEPGAHPVLSLDGSWLYMKEPCRGRMLGHDCNTLVENHPLPHRCSAEVPGFRVPVCYWCLPQLQYGV